MLRSFLARNDDFALIMKRYKRFLKRSLILFIIFLVAFNMLLYLVRRPDVQTYLTKKAADILSDRLGAKVSVGSVNLQFPLDLVMNRVYAGDRNRDTLMYVDEMKVAVWFRKLLNKQVDIRTLYLKDAKLYVHRAADSDTFNFEYLTGKGKPQAA